MIARDKRHILLPLLTLIALVLVIVTMAVPWMTMDLESGIDSLEGNSIEGSMTLWSSRIESNVGATMK